MLFRALFVIVKCQVLVAYDFELRPLPSFGAEVVNFKITDVVQRLGDGEPEAAAAAKAVALQLRDVLHRERLLAFRGQGSIPWEQQVAFTELFGSVFNESLHGNRKKHPAQPSDRIAVFSNDPDQGSTGVGIEGWHVDGNVVKMPHAATFIHAIAAVPGGDTFFVPLREAVQVLRERNYLRGRCKERAPPCSSVANTTPARTSDKDSSLPPLDDVLFQSRSADNVRHPLIYPHPVTGHDTMMVALGSLSGQYSTGCLQPSLPQTTTISEEAMGSAMEAIEGSLQATERVLRWRWASGDLIMVDNLAVAHHASAGSQSTVEEVGLRLMRRTTVENKWMPQKRPVLHTIPHECVAETLTRPSPPGPPANSPSAGHYCIFSLAGLMDYAPGQFDSWAVARERCRILSPEADLVMPSTLARNVAAGRVVSSVALPHWLGGTDQPNGHVTWLDGTDAVDSWGSDLPWHGPSGQPNDCDGPGSELCMFIGPGARWFDFACKPKRAFSDGNVTVTPGPEITWEDGIRREYNVHPLCGLNFYDNEAALIGLRI